MVASGDWLVPTIGGQPWLEKPPLPIWLVAGSSWVMGGVTEWSARVPSALAALGVAVGVASLAARRFGPTVGLLAGLIQATTTWTVLRGRLGEADMLLAALITGLIVVLIDSGPASRKSAPPEPVPTPATRRSLPLPRARSNHDPRPGRVAGDVLGLARGDGAGQGGRLRRGAGGPGRRGGPALGSGRAGDPARDQRPGDDRRGGPGAGLAGGGGRRVPRGVVALDDARRRPPGKPPRALHRRVAVVLFAGGPTPGAPVDAAGPARGGAVARAGLARAWGGATGSSGPGR